ncbi:MAG: PBP1A family penicillin-binding protein [bacterium]
MITKIYDNNDKLITELYTERRTLIPLSKIPVDLQNAVIAIEDEAFFKHWGISIKGIVRAFIINTFAGRVRQGGSTITQQLSKVLFLTQDRTITRKIKELILSLQLEYNFSKHEILQMYLNQIYFGKGSYGVQSASKLYFSKKVEELELAECAMLAGFPRAPNYYSPFKSPWRAFSRRKIVLKRMRELKYITEEEEKEANAFPLITEQIPQIPKVAPYFVEYIRIKLEPKYGSNAIYQGGLSIYTTLDIDIQKSAEEEFSNYLADFDARKVTELNKLMETKPELFPDPGITPYVVISTHTLNVEGSLIAMEPVSGAIRAMIGGRDFKKSQFNRATQAQRQPGSTFKPFVWNAAIQEGLTSSTTINDLPLAYYNDERDWRLLESATDTYSVELASAVFGPDKAWVPKNWDNKYFGPVTIRRGLEQSRNLVSVRLIDLVGPPLVVKLARKMGIKSHLDPVLSLGLGTSVVNLMELTNAFGTYANNGINVEPFSIRRVEDHQGRTLEEHIPHETEVIDSITNYLMVDLLKGVVLRGTGRRARELRRPTAGKTGTSQDFRDLWFIGFIPDLVAGVWMGYDDFHPLGDKLSSSGTIVPLWTNFMKGAIKKIPPRDFFVPPDIVFVRIDSDSGKLRLNSCPNVILDSFKRGTEPTEFCDIDHTIEIKEEENNEE